MSNELQGDIAVVTGAGRGIGRAIAEAYAAAGATVVCMARTAEQVQEVATAITTAGGSATALTADVGQRTEVERAMQAVSEAHGRIDLLVLNAGAGGRGAIADGAVDAWEHIVHVNLFGPFYCLRAAIPLLRQSANGRVVCVGSGMGHRAQEESSAYSSSKAGLSMLVRAAALELEADDIAVNELIPGPVRTTMNPNPNPARFGKEWFKEPADVVPLAMFLASQPRRGPSGQAYSLMRRQR